MARRKTLYGSETKKAVDNFPISGETVPVSVIHWLGRIKGAAARANPELGKLDPKLARASARAGGRVNWLGRMRGAAARANADLGKLDPKLADAIARAGDEVAAGDHDAQF